MEHGQVGAARMSERTAEPSTAADAVRRLTHWVEDFPHSGVRFADLTPVFADADAYRSIVDEFAARASEVDAIAAIDARGFLLGGGVGLALGAGVVAVRKSGKLPPPVIAESYTLEYGSSTLEIPASAVDLRGKRVLVVDDVLATGGTLAATARLIESAGAEVVGVCVVLEIAALDGRRHLEKYPLFSVSTA
ncbi:MAG: adenine phosphoribosyltransferase [Rhodococcus sp.]|nr:adenine phosphoribosyltransferase [Rhodococcus sp. (in: high G+C Gram-positive bacteria)]